MKPETLLRLYPRRWRQRYGDEFVALLEREGTSSRVVLNVLAGAFDAWMSPGRQDDMAMDGPIGPHVLWRRPPEAETDLYSKSHWLHIFAAMGAGLLVHGIGQLVHPGRQFPITFLAGFMAGLQFWFFRFFSVRTQVAACFWALVVMIGGSVLIHESLHRFVYPLFVQ